MKEVMTRERLIEPFPAFEEIADTELREVSMKAMLLAMETGGWNADNIMLAPVTLSWEDCRISLVEHVNDVAAMCRMQYDYVKKYYERNAIAFSRDIVITGALLHDIGKFTEFVCRDGRGGPRRGLSDHAASFVRCVDRGPRRRSQGAGTSDRRSFL